MAQGDPKHLDWYDLASGLSLGSPPSGIWAGVISISSWRRTSEATTTGSDSDRCSEVFASLSLEYIIGLGKMVVFMAKWEI